MIPSGKHTNNYRKIQFFMGKSVKIHYKWWFSIVFCMFTQAGSISGLTKHGGYTCRPWQPGCHVAAQHPYHSKPWSLCKACSVAFSSDILTSGDDPRDAHRAIGSSRGAG